MLGRALLTHGPSAELAEVVRQRLAFDLDVSPLVRDRIEAFPGLNATLKRLISICGPTIGTFVFEFALERVPRVSMLAGVPPSGTIT